MKGAKTRFSGAMVSRQARRGEFQVKHASARSRVMLGVLGLTLSVSCSSSGDSPERAASGPTPSASVSGTPSSAAPSVAPSTEAPSTASSSVAPEPAAAPSPSETSLAPGEAVDGGGTCTLLTPEEVSAELGVIVGDGRYTEAGLPFGNKICTWGSDELPTRVYTLSLQNTADMAPKLVQAGGGAPKLYRQAANLQRQSAGSIERVTGIGREAFVVKSAIFAIKGDTFITANALFSDGTDARDVAIELTRLAVSRL